MSTSRRQFLSKLSGGAAAVAALVATRGIATGEVVEVSPEEVGGFTPRERVTKIGDLSEDKGTLWTTSLFEDGVVKIRRPRSKNPPILRIAHNVSVWCREGHVEPGHWFAHKNRSKVGTDLGCNIICDRIEYVGLKAMLFDDSLRHGRGPIRVSTDPDSIMFKNIVDEVNLGPHLGGKFALYGPVYRVWAVPGSQSIHSHDPFVEYELFCGNKSSRKFAHEELGKGVQEICQLRVKEVSDSRGRYKWFVMTLNIPGVTKRPFLDPDRPAVGVNPCAEITLGNPKRLAGASPSPYDLSDPRHPARRRNL